MYSIRKLPFLSGCLAAILTGIISFAAGVDSQMIYIRMAVMMLLFFILGVYIRNNILSIRRELEIRRLEKEAEEEMKLKKLKEEKKAQTLASRKSKDANTDASVNTQQDDFEPLTVSRAIKTKVEE